ncbi:MAG: DNA cytosine methyltransferase [Acidobacteriota bacterium]|nr:DNA cytosine methyltransferase [Acidobacteriota bacterium]
MTSVELFTGAGGLALGIEGAGFRHDVVVERDRYCCETIRRNQSRGFAPLSGWRIVSGDVRNFDYRSVGGKIDLLAGGPPCQPFSIGGKHQAHRDSRDMFPEMVRAVRELRPSAILVENVKGLTRKAFADYFSYIVLQLSHPEITRDSGENWTEHRVRLERHHTKGKWHGLEYNIVSRLVNAANYGVPQKRERIFFVGFRSDLGVEWAFPEETHSLDALLDEQWVSGEYWDRHKISKKDHPAIAGRLASRIARLREEDGMTLFPKRPWRTVRDAISDLPDPEYANVGEIPNHIHNPGARSYAGHTGSAIDETAKALKAGDHGVPGGENTVVLPDGRIRYFTVRESARIQTFPDDYVFHGSWTESMRQLGNAVPVLLGETIALAIRQRLACLR